MPVRPDPTLPVSSRTLLSDPERLLYGRLVRAVPGHIVLAKVAVSSLLERVPAGDAGSAHPKRLREWIADFVICAGDFAVAAVLELDRRSQQRESERAEDHRKSALLKAAGIRVFRVPITGIPSEAGLKALLALRPLQSAASLRRAS